jgi:transcriptional regulator with XRE-family HTH domain
VPEVISTSDRCDLASGVSRGEAAACSLAAMDLLNVRQHRTAKRDLMRRLGREIRALREDAGRSQRSVASAAGVAQSHLSGIEAGAEEPSVDILLRISAVLGADLSLRTYPRTGARIRDHLQLAMSEALLRRLHPRWHATPEVPVYRPVRGVIDLMLEDQRGPDTVSTELQSQLRRVEQQVRWAAQKSDAVAALPGQGGRRVSRLLVLRNTAAMREVVRAASETLGASYPARAADAVASLTGDAAWPGAAIAWMTVERGAARLLDAPPRGIQVGR